MQVDCLQLYAKGLHSSMWNSTALLYLPFFIGNFRIAHKIVNVHCTAYNVRMPLLFYVVSFV